MRMDEKIAEAENKVYSLRSELARVSGRDCPRSMSVAVVLEMLIDVCSVGFVRKRGSDDTKAQGTSCQVRTWSEPFRHMRLGLVTDEQM